MCLGTLSNLPETAIEWYIKWQKLVDILSPYIKEEVLLELISRARKTTEM